IIETPYSKRIGYKQNTLERLLSKSNLTKKYFKALVHIRGLQQLEKAVKPGNYNKLWCAGKSSELVTEIKPISKIVKDLNLELKEAFENLSKSFNP
ncbi:MAG: nitronate monooxygenase, partial [Bacteroidota bacterium]